MTRRLPTDLLRRSVDEGSRLLALGYLDETGAAERRLTDPLDPEALHDFRVGLRRLRSSIRAYRSQLDDCVPGKIRRRLRELTEATNPVRDAEVQLSWLHRQANRLPPGQTEGLAWLVGRLEERKAEALDRVTADVAKRFVKTALRLRRRLGTFEVEVRTGKQPKPASFGEVTGGLIQQHTEELAKRLTLVGRPEDVTQAHAARLGAKRLRYLLEPLARRAPGVKAMVGRLKELQDTLGTFHDMHVIAQEIRSALASLSRSPVGQPLAAEPGLLALQRLADQGARESYANFQTSWANGNEARFLSRTHELGKRLSKGPRPATQRPVGGDVPAIGDAGTATPRTAEGNGASGSNGAAADHSEPRKSREVRSEV
jgi:CHAD domain-containing protein